MNKQQRILANVTERGHRAGWTIEQFLMRQFTKLAEETCELVLSVHWNGSIQIDRLREYVLVTGEQAKRVFKDRTLWPDTAISEREIEAIKAELADVVVTCACIAGVIEELTGEPVDLMRLAVEKSRADVKRGVRV